MRSLAAPLQSMLLLLLLLLPHCAPQQSSLSGTLA
jgi:hypothetical protein